MFDVPQTNIAKYFDEASNFIEDAISSGGNDKKSQNLVLSFLLIRGKVLVHCLMGMSRSATLVLAFLVKRRNMNVLEALRLVS